MLKKTISKSPLVHAQRKQFLLYRKKSRIVISVILISFQSKNRLFNESPTPENPCFATLYVKIAQETPELERKSDERVKVKRVRHKMQLSAGCLFQQTYVISRSWALFWCFLSNFSFQDVKIWVFKGEEFNETKGC